MDTAAIWPQRKDAMHFGTLCVSGKLTCTDVVANLVHIFFLCRTLGCDSEHSLLSLPWEPLWKLQVNIYSSFVFILLRPYSYLNGLISAVEIWHLYVFALKLQEFALLQYAWKKKTDLAYSWLKKGLLELQMMLILGNKYFSKRKM